MKHRMLIMRIIRHVANLVRINMCVESTLQKREQKAMKIRSERNYHMNRNRILVVTTVNYLKLNESMTTFTF